MPSRKPRTVVGVSLFAALLLSACGQAAAKPNSTVTLLPTLPTTPLPTLPPTLTVAIIQSSGQPVWGNVASWSHAGLPAGFGMQFHISDLGVAASDGKTAYSCAAPGDPTRTGNPRVVVTHDGGASWTYVTGLRRCLHGLSAAIWRDTLAEAGRRATGGLLHPVCANQRGWYAVEVPG